MDIQQMQRELDEMVLAKERERGLVLKKETLLRYTLSALRVELAELQNEMKTELGSFAHWKTKPTDISKAREEAIDCLHFLVSLCNQVGFVFKFEGMTLMDSNLDMHFDIMYSIISEMKDGMEYFFDTECIVDFLKRLQQIFYYLGMSITDIEKEYQRKYEINIQRQNNGY